jgi:hypothetical protein
MKKQNKLIFLISQPRSGSTLLQKLLGQHSQIYSCPEPWLMLPQLYRLKPQGTYAEYDEILAYKAHQDFFCQFPDGDKHYLREIERAYRRIYEAAARGHNKSMFLDKTPRYYLIIDALLECFPQASFIVLIRNPLAVLSSIINSFYKKDLEQLCNDDGHYLDIIEAPRLLVEALEKYPGRCLKVQYEALVSDQENTLRDICRHIGINYERKILTYQNDKEEKGKMGDQWNIYRHNEPIKKYVNRWQQNMPSSKTIGFLDGYCDFLGSETISKLGYTYVQGKEQILKLRNRYSDSRRLQHEFNSGRRKFILYSLGIFHEIKTLGKIMGSVRAHDLFRQEGFNIFGARQDNIKLRIRRYAQDFIKQDNHDLCREWLKQFANMPDIGLQHITELYDHAISLQSKKCLGEGNKLQADVIHRIKKDKDRDAKKVFEIANRLFLLGRYKESIRYYTLYFSLSRKRVDHPFDFLKACECMVSMPPQKYCTNKDYYINKGIAFIRKFKKKTVFLRYTLASFLKRKNEYKKARDLFSELIRETKDENIRGKAHYHLGDIAGACGDKGKAHKEYSLAVQLCPEHRQARVKIMRGR